MFKLRWDTTQDSSLANFGELGWVVVLIGNITTPWVHLASWNLPDSQLSSVSKIELSVAVFIEHSTQME